MNETTHEQPPAATSGPRIEQARIDRARVDALDQLRRSRTDRHVAGVAGGLGRHFNIDPTVIRVLLVVLVFFGGAGLVIYGALWLLVPEEGTDEATVSVRGESRKVLIFLALGIAAVLVLGDAFGGHHVGWPLAGVALLAAILLLFRDRSRGAASTTPDSTGVTGGTGGTEHDPESPSDGVTPPRRPLVPSYSPPRRPRRTGIVWFWPTLALIAIALGGLGLYDADHHVADGAYPALALGITGVMLLVGSIVGRPGGLILVGSIAALVLAANTAVGGSFGVDAKQLEETPASAAAVQAGYHATVGQIVLDLSRVSDPEALAGRSVRVTLRTGEIRVVVPRSLNVRVHADLGIAGGIRVPGDDSGGINHSTDRYLAGSPTTTAEPLELDLDARLGQITVEQQ